MHIVTRHSGGRTAWAALGFLMASVWSGWTMPGVAAPEVSAPTPVVAASALIADLHVDIWPEHDDPRVLIIYRGQLSAGVALPYALTFAIPPSGQVNAAAYRSSDGALLSADYQYRQDGDRLLVTFTIPTRAFQFEYYADLIKGRPRRSLVAEVVLPLPVENMRVSVEQPRRAAGFVLSPPAATTTATPTGLTHHLYTVGRWPAGRVWSVRVIYDKADETPSLPRTSAPVGPPPPGAAVPAARTSAWLWAAAVLAFLGVGALAAFWVLERRAAPRPLSGPGPGSAARRKDRTRPASEAPFCTQCGYRARPGDRFCSRCGRALRQA